MKSAFALIAVAGIAGAANAQLIDVVVDGGQTVEFADEASATVVNISLYLDRNGATDGFFADFAGWSTFGGTFAANGGTFASFTEDGSELTGIDPNGNVAGADTWTAGRRPGGIEFFGNPLNNGSFRYPNPSTNIASYDGGSTLELAGGGNFEGFQGGSALGNQAPDASERIEVFRATIDFTGVAAGTYSIDFLASSLAIGFGDLDTARSVVDGATVSGATVTIVPAPASAALLGLGGLAAARRRR